MGKTALVISTIITCIVLFGPCGLSAAQNNLTSHVSLQAENASTPPFLQFTADGHIIGFRSKDMFIASTDHALKIEFIGAKAVSPSSENKSSSASGELKIAAPLSKVTYPDLWEGVTLVYERQSGAVAKSTYHIAPNRSSSIKQIRLRYNVPVQVDAGGNLALNFDTGQMRESAPVAWQEISGQRIPVKVAFRCLGEREVGFSMDDYNSSFPLVIDPTLTWNTFMGSSGGDDSFTGIALDSSGNVYVGGYSDATWGSPVNAFAGDTDAFAAKLDSSGNRTWNTFMGSSGYDYGRGIAIDSSGDVYVFGDSDATWGSPVNALAGGNDAFAAKLDSSGNRTWNTFMGSSLGDRGGGIAVDSSGNVYVGGYSDATWGSPVNAHAGTCVNCGDAFAAKLNSSGNRTWHTFMGGSDYDFGVSIAIDSSGNVYLGGRSKATWGSPVNAHSGMSDIFAAKLNSSGNRTWHTFMGSSGDDYGIDIAVDSSGNVYIGGYSDATWGSPVNALAGGNDAFAAKLDSSGNRTWHTFMGSSGYDQGRGIAVDSSGNVYVRGYSDATWGSPINAHAGGGDAFAAKLDSSGNRIWHTFMGSSGDDYGRDIAINSNNNVFLGGWSSATWGTPVNAYAGGEDVFAAKLSDQYTLSVTISPSGGGSVTDTGINCPGDCSENCTYGTDVTLTATPAAGYQFNAWSGDYSGSTNPDTITMNGNKNVTAEFSTAPSSNPDPDPEPDPEPPTVSSTSPSNDATNVAVNSDITASFSQAMDGTTITTSTFTVVNSTGDVVSGNVSYNPQATFYPTQNLKTNTTYTATITTGAQDADGVALASDHTWSFTTAAGSAPNTPSGSSPVDLTRMTGTSVTLKGSTFDDPDAGDTHTESQLQVRMAGQPYGRSSYPASFTQTVTIESLTTFTVSDLVDGMKYYWQICYLDSGSNYSAWSAEISFIVGTSIPDNSVVIGTGSSAYDFQMVSFCQFPNDPSITSILGLSTPLDTTNYRIGTYDPLSGSYVEYGRGLEIEPGRGYWFLCRNGLSITVNGVPCTCTQAVEMEMKYNSATGDGWNMIGPPNPADYTWSEVQIVVYDAAGNIVFGPASIGSLASDNPYINILLYRYENDGLYYSDTTRVEQCKGFWVEIKQGYVYLRFTSSAQVARGASGLKMMLAGFFDRAHRWSRKWILASPVAIADGSGPPAPPGDFYNPGTAGAGGSGCFIATAAFGSPLMPHAQILRAFRDRFLSQNRLGNFLVKAYYRYSPPMAHYITQHYKMKKVVRLGLLPVVGGCWFILTLDQMNLVVLIILFWFVMICLYVGYRFRKAK